MSKDFHKVLRKIRDDLEDKKKIVDSIIKMGDKSTEEKDKYLRQSFKLNQMLESLNATIQTFAGFNF